jgi:TctA family transporter
MPDHVSRPETLGLSPGSGFISRPISLGFFVITLVLLISSPIMAWLKKHYRELETEAK